MESQVLGEEKRVFCRGENRALYSISFYPFDVIECQEAIDVNVFM